MSGVVSFLLFGVFFFFMMRMGCGSHVGHGGHGGHGDDKGNTGHGGDGDSAQPMLASTVDPVCLMQVEAGSGYAKVYQGVQYRFCSRDCLDKFEASPDRYARGEPGANGPSAHSEHGGHAS